MEGFADFFAVWVGGAGLTDGLALYDDFAAEGNLERVVGNGSLVEGAVAALLYDIVDGTSEPDGPQNQTGADDDAVTWPGSFVVDALKTCWLRETGTNIAYSKLDGIDQLVYCLDFPTINPPPPFGPQTALDPATGQRFFLTGRQYYQIAVAYDQPPSWNPAYLRQLWLYNLYGEGSLP